MSFPAPLVVFLVHASSRSSARRLRYFTNSPPLSTEQAAFKASVLFSSRWNTDLSRAATASSRLFQLLPPQVNAGLFPVGVVPLLRRLIPSQTLQLLLSGPLLLLGCRPPSLTSRQLFSRLLAVVEPLEHWLQLVYVDADIDLGRVANLLHSPPESFLLNVSIFVGPAHMHSMDRESVGKSIVVEGHIRSSGLVTRLAVLLAQLLGCKIARWGYQDRL